MDVFNKVTGSLLWNEQLGIKDFDIGPKVGAGGFSDVYLCWRKGKDKTLAMKVVKKRKLFKLIDDGQSKRREDQIVREKNMLQLHIPHAIHLHYAFQDNHALYLVMDYCPGGPLFDLIQEFGPMLEEEAKFYLTQIIYVVNHLHKLGFLHRDIKPDNFLIDIDGHLKMCDFGFSANIGAPSNSLIVGSMSYISPEVVSEAKYSTASDWYSVGVVLFEFLSKAPIHYGANEAEYFSGKIFMSDTIDQIIELNEYREQHQKPKLSRICMDLLLGLLKTDPKTRLGFEQIIAHPFFKDVDWDNLYQVAPPFEPVVLSRLELYIELHKNKSLKTKDTKFSAKPSALYAKPQNLAVHQSQMLQKKFRELQLRPISAESMFLSSKQTSEEKYQKDFFTTTKLEKHKNEFSSEEIFNHLQNLRKNAENYKNWEIMVFCHLAENVLSIFRNKDYSELTSTEKKILGDFFATIKTYNFKFQRDNNYSDVEKIKGFLPRSTSQEHISVFGEPEHTHLSQRIWQYVPNFNFTTENINPL